MASTSDPRPSNEVGPSADNEGATSLFSIPVPVKNFFTRTGKHVNRHVNMLGSQANQVVGFIMGKEQEVSRGHKRLEMRAEGCNQPQMGPKARECLRVSLRVGAGILAAVVTLKVGGALKGGGKKGNRNAKKAKTPVKAGVRMKEDMDKKARAAAASVARAIDEVKTTAKKTKDACDRTRDACLKATAGSMEFAADTKAIYDAALEGAQKKIKETNERKRKEAEKKIEQQPKRKQSTKKAKEELPEEPPKELSEPLKSLELVKDILTEKVERVYFHVFP